MTKWKERKIFRIWNHYAAPGLPKHSNKAVWRRASHATELGRGLVAASLNAPQQCVAGWSWPTLLRYWLGASRFGSMDRAFWVRWVGEFRGTVWELSQGLCRVVPPRDSAGYQVKKRCTPAQQDFQTSFTNIYYYYYYYYYYWTQRPMIHLFRWRHRN
jgi:hypothetical protein